MSLSLAQRRPESSSSRRRGRRFLAFALLVHAAAGAAAGQSYQKPPQAVLDVLNAPVPPQAAISPARDHMLLVQGTRYPPLRELAQPMLRLAGLRINPNTSGPHRAAFYVSMTLMKIADGSERKVELPPGARTGMPVWSPDGKRFAFTNTTDTGIELWAGEAAGGRPRRLRGVVVNAVSVRPSAGQVVQWMPDNRTLLVQTVPAGRGAPPA